MDLQQVLMEEVAKMDRKQRCRIKTRYSRDKELEEYALDRESYKKGSNFKSR